MSSGRPDTRRAILEAALHLLEAGERPFTFEEVAVAAQVSRQGVYLHFKSRAELIVAVVEHVKITSGLDDAVRMVREAQGPDAALDALIDLHVRFTPLLFPSYRAVAMERARDREIEAAWEARESSRIHHVRLVMERFAAEDRLAEGWSVADAADLVWAMTSPPATEDLMVRRGWSAKKVGKRLREVITSTLVRTRRRKS